MGNATDRIRYIACESEIDLDNLTFQCILIMFHAVII